jgi:hypothetical protein
LTALAEVHYSAPDSRGDRWFLRLQTSGFFPAIRVLAISRFHSGVNPCMNTASLTQDAFEKLLRWLDPDRDKAGEKLARIQARLIAIFSSRGCLDPESLADKTTNVVIGKTDWLLANYVGDPALYFYGVAKNVYRESLKPARSIPPPPPPDPEPPELEDVCEYLDECLNKLSPRDRDTAVRYHEGEKGERIENRKKLAAELKISPNALRIRVCHLHGRLRKCIERLQRAAAG